MKTAAWVIAIGVMGGAALMAPHLLWSLSWVTSLLALAAWIGLAPTLMARRRGHATDAGWLAGLSLSTIPLLLGVLSAVAGLVISYQALPDPSPAIEIAADAPPEEVITTVLGVEIQPDLESDTITLNLTHVQPGSPAERIGFEEGHRILAANGIRLADEDTDPRALGARRADHLADSAERVRDSLQISLERDRQIQAASEERLEALRQSLESARWRGDIPVDSSRTREERAKSDSLAAAARRLTLSEEAVNTADIRARELRSLAVLAQEALAGTDQTDQQERQARLMVTRLARELKLLADGKTVTLRVQTPESTSTWTLHTGRPGKLTHSTLAFAVLLIGMALALGAARLTWHATEVVTAINTQRAFESRHTTWQRELAAAAAAAPDGPVRKVLADCAEASRYAGRDPSADGTPVNAQIDGVVQSLCRTPPPSEAELTDLGSSLRALIVQRENFIRSNLTARASGR